jgi:uncharacterized membrane protein (UPF0182 family)
MPQLKKIVLAMGNRLIYEDTFERALNRIAVSGFHVPRSASEAPEMTQAPGEPPRAAPDTGESDRNDALASRLLDLKDLAEGLVTEIEELERELRR